MQIMSADVCSRRSGDSSCSRLYICKRSWSLHLASTICKVACPAPCIAPHLLTQFWFCRARQLVNLRHQTMMLLCLSRTWKWMKVTTKWLLSVHSSGCRIIIAQVIARWKERGWMIGTRGSRGVGYIGVAAGCLVWSVRISVRISQWIQWIHSSMLSHVWVTHGHFSSFSPRIRRSDPFQCHLCRLRLLPLVQNMTSKN